MRTLRLAPAQAVFDAIAITPTALDYKAITWARLCKTSYPNQFFPSPGSRLTPISRKFPCVYLGTSLNTAVAEIWSDRFYDHRAIGNPVYTIPISEAKKSGFLTVTNLPALKLCDLTNADTLLAVGIDSAAIYATDLKIPQGWAEVIARHPAGFDGIIYRSRHTGEICMVIWLRPGGRGLDKELTFEPAGPFLFSHASYAVAQKIGLKLAFA
jgi:hypothetical protein